jgi:hypothetical protein
MNSTRLKNHFMRLSMIGGLAVVWAQAPAHAGSYVINFDTKYNGDNPTASNGLPVGPGNSGLIATFTDTIANQVKLELQGKLLEREYFDGLAFNLDPSILPSALSIPVVGGCTAPGTICSNYTATFPATQNAFILQGNGNGNGFDFGFEFANPNAGGGTVRFNGTELVTLLINGPGITAQSFAYVNTPSGQGSDYVGYGGAKVNGIPGGGSGAIGTNGTTSVPGPLPILGAAAAFGCSRKIRTLIRSSRQQATIS